MRLALRQPMWVAIGVLQPILYLTLFGPLLVPLANAPGDAWTIFVPGLLVERTMPDCHQLSSRRKPGSSLAMAQEKTGFRLSPE